MQAEAYQGESDVEKALGNLIKRIGELVSSQEPRIPNPVNPAEDFADKWSTPEEQNLNLENNFWSWLEQAQADFENIGKTDDMAFISEHAKEKFGVDLNSSDLQKKLAIGTPSIIVEPKDHEITEPTQPWTKHT